MRQCQQSILLSPGKHPQTFTLPLPHVCKLYQLIRPSMANLCHIPTHPTAQGHVPIFISLLHRGICKCLQHLNLIDIWKFSAQFISSSKVSKLLLIEDVRKLCHCCYLYDASCHQIDIIYIFCFTQSFKHSKYNFINSIVTLKTSSHFSRRHYCCYCASSAR